MFHGLARVFLYAFAWLLECFGGAGLWCSEGFIAGARCCRRQARRLK